jgi:hypothetical protein
MIEVRGTTNTHKKMHSSGAEAIENTIRKQWPELKSAQSHAIVARLNEGGLSSTGLRNLDRS